MPVWDEGDIVTFSGTNVAGNVESTKTPTKNRKLKVLYGMVKLTTNATVGNRNIIFYIKTSGGTVISYMWASSNVAASQTDYTTYILPICGYNGGSIQNGPYNNGDMIITGTDKFTIYINSGLAGDSYTFIIKMVELPQ